MVDTISRKSQKKCQSLRRCNSVKQNDDKHARKFYQGISLDDMYTFYQGISLDDMYTYHQANANAVFKKNEAVPMFYLWHTAKLYVGAALAK